MDIINWNQNFHSSNSELSFSPADLWFFLITVAWSQADMTRLIIYNNVTRTKQIPRNYKITSNIRLIFPCQSSLALLQSNFRT